MLELEGEDLLVRAGIGDAELVIGDDSEGFFERAPVSATDDFLLIGGVPVNPAEVERWMNRDLPPGGVEGKEDPIC